MSINSYGQTYPLWFLEQGKAGCENIAVGFSPHSYYQDSTAVENATLQAYLQAVKRLGTEIVSNQAVWTTAIGPMLWRKDVTVKCDTSLLKSVKSSFAVIDTFSEGELVMVLISKNCSNLADFKKLINIKNYPKPEWIGKTPNDNNYVYGVGYAEKYFYSVSSWVAAQKAAMLDLAVSKHLTTSALQKNYNYEYESQVSENTRVKLLNLEVVGRWLDVKNKVYYVLMRMPKE